MESVSFIIFMVKATSSAFRSSPSDHLMPSRILMVHSVKSSLGVPMSAATSGNCSPLTVSISHIIADMS